MDRRLIGVPLLALFIGSCQSVYDSKDFIAQRPSTTTTQTAKATPAGDDAAATASEAAAADTAKTETPAADATAAAAAAAPAPSSRSLFAIFQADPGEAAPAAPGAATPTDGAPADAASTTDTAKAETTAEGQTKPADGAPAADAAAAAATDEAVPTPAPGTVVKATETPPRGFLAMFRAPTANASPAAAEAAKAIATEAPLPVDDPSPEEFSEAELAGEVEADPSKIAVPEPFDDGEAHDFVNVYTSKPDAPVEKIEGLPGVDWEGGIVYASRGPDDDPSNFFDGPVHPFARTVPGIPSKVVQAANGLLLAHSAINVSCIKPNLLNLVRRAEGHFGRKVVVTSGYRSPTHNRRVRGAKHSQHMFCAALDLYMPGVSRDDLARYFFAQPDRGGIGLYCHTRSIHVDVGKRRQWRWSCRKRG